LVNLVSRVRSTCGGVILVRGEDQVKLVQSLIKSV